VIEWLPEARIAERVPVAADLHAGRVGRHLGVAVARDAVVVEEGDRRVEHGCGRRHRAERLAPVDAPARLGARGGGLRPGEVLAQLADGGGDDHAVARDRAHRGGEDLGASRVVVGDGQLPAPHDVHEDDEVHVDADGDGRVAAGQAARRDDHVVHRGDVEAAVLGGDRGGEVLLALERVDAGVRERRVAVVLGGA
jgi:hypothetical protein